VVSEGREPGPKRTFLDTGKGLVEVARGSFREFLRDMKADMEADDDLNEWVFDPKCGHLVKRSSLEVEPFPALKPLFVRQADGHLGAVED